MRIRRAVLGLFFTAAAAVGLSSPVLHATPEAKAATCYSTTCPLIVWGAQIVRNLATPYGDASQYTQGDVLRLDFNRAVVVHPDQLYIHVVDKNGKTWVLEDGGWNSDYGIGYMLEPLFTYAADGTMKRSNARTLRLTVNETPGLVYPLTITRISGVFQAPLPADYSQYKTPNIVGGRDKVW